MAARLKPGTEKRGQTTFLKKRGLTPFFLTPFFRAAARQDLCRSFVPNGRLFRYGAEQRCACSETG
ncbi:MAG: hypothetical protein ACREVC_16655, partial [Burkholderiales bacterium]